MFRSKSLDVLNASVTALDHVTPLDLLTHNFIQSESRQLSLTFISASTTSLLRHRRVSAMLVAITAVLLKVAAPRIFTEQL